MSGLTPLRRRMGTAYRERGAASLIVVMILFFVISMVAAYTNRNLIFEQKTAANQQRSTRALEAADAGVEWALTMLNSGRITDACTTSTDTAVPTFRQRYLNISADTGNIVPRKKSDGGDLHPTCVYNGTGWSCSCPTDGDPAVASPGSDDIYPAFRVRFRRVCALPTASDSACVDPVQPGVIHVDVNACTTLSDDCLRFSPAPASVAGEGRVTVRIVAALRGALPQAPVAALTVRQGFDLTGTVVNSERQVPTGFTVHAGRDKPVAATYPTLQGTAGTPAEQTLFVNDSKLEALTADRFFTHAFGIRRNTFLEQPATVVIDCAASCSAATLRAKAALNPGRVFWVVGNLDLDSAGDIGSPTDPVVLNVTGNVGFSGGPTVFGLVYSQAANWSWSGGGSIVGAAMAEGGVAGGSAGMSIVYNGAILTRLRTMTGSFVRVPGTWRDFDT